MSITHIAEAASPLSHALPRYLYLPLDAHNNEIRLVTLHPGSHGALLKISLYHTSLSPTSTQPPNYEALSYAWGDPTPTHSVLISPSPFQAPTHALHTTTSL